jgi:predicted transglutaminase-like cysteine proteinase
MRISKSITALLAAGGALLGAVPIAQAGTPSMRLSGPTVPPIGHVQFCAAYPGECGAYDAPNQIVRLTRGAFDRLEATNQAVNDAVLPATDMEIFGTLERWDYPSLVGDCEDYVLEKRRELVALGWPESALLITVVRDEIGEGHAVLTVRTDRGDLILDNKTDEIVLWDVAPYQFVKRQSASAPSDWDAVEDGRTAAVGSLR